ncbi:MAG: hypothetical protein NFW16_20390 [Candidatus Accumulibacter sp.]|uniref:hypothetical protein n=1 Tax=Accumulibacter sp. TaxID=2053492 RepID=UPI002582556A|nr:hypothetical protein [Accumulibacter sp.]MCM8624024.1 hypothetical protein [Accumulibacter sp.]
MTDNKKPASAGTGTGSSAAFSARHSITSALLCWLASISTTAACVVSLAAPIVAALSGLIAGVRL